MKKILFPALAVLALFAASCAKDHQCKCETTDITDDGLLKIMTVAGSLSCDAISQMGFEVKYVDTASNVQSLRREEVHSVKCIDYGK